MASDSDPDPDLAEVLLLIYRRGGPAAVTEHLRKHPEIAGQARAILPALLFLEGAPGDVAPTGPVPGASPAQARPTRLGDYRLLREIGRGGMGVVYEAEQVSLVRRVAIKVLALNAHLDPRTLERFHREARAAAQLQHPHIVTVFGVGEDEGLHFYAMRLVDGRGLDRVIEDLRRARRARRGLPPSETPADTHQATERDPWTEDLSGGTPSRAACIRIARLGAQVAGALAHAHDQGVLHRDIKPSNLILDRWGDAWLADFGLAKTIEGGDLTRSGEILGTLRYMAPERLAGWSDPRTDIYGLGCVLYELLTLRPVHVARNRARLMRLIAEHDPVRPRRVDPSVPRDLEAIVLKALARDPARRYRSAADLAHDLHAFLEGRPVLARTHGPWTRAVRWSRRRPAAAALVGVSALALVLLIGGILFHVHTLSTALDASGRHAARARRAVDRLSDFARELRSVPVSEEVRRAYLKEAARYYREVLDEGGPAGGRGRDAAEALRRLAAIHHLLGEHEEAEVAVVEARRMLALLAAEAGLPGDRRMLALVSADHALLLEETGRHDEAVATYRESAALLLGEDSGHPPEHAAEGARVLAALGRLLLEEDPLLAWDTLARALTLGEAALTARPGDPTPRTDVASLRVDLARCHLFRGEGAAARALVKRAIEDLDGLPEDGPQVATRARAVSLLGTLRHAAGDVEGAVLAYREATGALDRLVLAFPRVLLYREHRAATASNLGMALDDACGVGLPCAHAEARAAIRRALTDQSLLVREHPAIPRLRVEMARTHQNLARSLIQGVHGPRTAEEREEAEATLREGLALLDEIDHPRNGVSERAALASTLGVHLASAGRAEEAEVFHGAAVRALEALVRLDPDKAPLQGELAAHLCNQAQALLDGQDPAAALPLVDRALGHLQVARDRSPENPTWQRFEHNVHWTRGRACIRLGRHGDAAAAAEAIAGSAQTVAALDLALDLIRGAHRVAATEEGGFRGPAALYLERQRSLEAARHLAATASPPR